MKSQANNGLNGLSSPTGGSGGFSEGAFIVGEATDGTDDAIQKGIFGGCGK
jgi:hypothetical protein